MKNKIIATILLITSIILVLKSLTPLKIYNYVRKGNELIKSEKFNEGREYYNKALALKEDSKINSNLLKSFYKEKNYEEVTKSSAEENFLKGNSWVYLGDSSPENSQEFYKKALEEYKLAMKKSDDINIKKNYELTLKKLENSSQQNQQEQKDNQEKQENQEKQNNQNQEQNQQQKNNEEKSDNNQENSNPQNQENEQENSSNKQQTQQDKDSEQEKENNKDTQNDEKQEQNNENSSQQNQEEKQGAGSDSKEIKPQSQEEIREQEVRAILQRLEGNEKQAFKNNERVMEMSNHNSTNRW